MTENDSVGFLVKWKFLKVVSDGEIARTIIFIVIIKRHAIIISFTHLSTFDLQSKANNFLTALTNFSLQKPCKILFTVHVHNIYIAVQP